MAYSDPQGEKARATIKRAQARYRAKHRDTLRKKYKLYYKRNRERILYVKRLKEIRRGFYGETSQA